VSVANEYLCLFLFDKRSRLLFYKKL